MPDDNQDNRALLAESLWNHDDPTIREGFRNLIATAHPRAKASMPDVLAREAIAPELAAVRKERAEWQREREAERTERTTKAWREKLTSGFRAPDDSLVRIAPEDLPKVEKYMTDEAIGSPEVAAFAWNAQQRVAAPRASVSGVQIPGHRGAGGDHFKGIMDNPDQWAREKAETIWSDIRAGRGAQWLDT